MLQNVILNIKAKTPSFQAPNLWWILKRKTNYLNEIKTTYTWDFMIQYYTEKPTPSLGNYTMPRILF